MAHMLAMEYEHNLQSSVGGHPSVPSTAEACMLVTERVDTFHFMTAPYAASPCMTSSVSASLFGPSDHHLNQLGGSVGLHTRCTVCSRTHRS